VRLGARPRIDSGSTDGVDVSDLTLALSVHIPGNALTPASWKAAVTGWVTARLTARVMVRMTAATPTLMAAATVGMLRG
jgi:hypothetical protein